MTSIVKRSEAERSEAMRSEVLVVVFGGGLVERESQSHLSRAEGWKSCAKIFSLVMVERLIYWALSRGGEGFLI